MPHIFLIVSYPKSGNTWMRALLQSLLSGGSPLDINAIDVGAMLPRVRFDWFFSVESSSLTAAEISELRPRFLREWAAGAPDETVLMKAHEANLPWPGTSVSPYPPDLIAGAIHIVRDPRDVAVSYTATVALSLDRTIDLLADPDWTLSRQRNRLSFQLPQRISSWSAHVSSWLDAPDFNVCTVRYEDLLADTPAKLTEVAGFLGLDATADAIERAVESARFDNLQRQEAAAGFRENAAWVPRFFRRGQAGGWRDSLTPEQAARIERDHSEIMQRLRYL